MAKKSAYEPHYGKMAVGFESRMDFEKLRRERLQRTKDTMAQFGIDALITFDCDAQRYICDYFITTPCRKIETAMCFLANTPDSNAWMIGGPYQVKQLTDKMPWLDGVIGGLGAPRLSARDCDDPVLNNYVNATMERLEEYGMDPAEITLGIDGSTLQGLFMQAFEKRGVKCVSCKHVMDEARVCKTPEELILLKMACDNVSKAFSRIVEEAKPGMKEFELAGIVAKALYEEGCEHIEDPVVSSGCMTNPLTVSCTDRMILPGDLFFLDIAGNQFHGYTTCLYRTFSMGQPSEEQMNSYRKCLELLENSYKNIKAGATSYDIYKNWPDDPGYWGPDYNWNDCTPFAVGHGVGLSLHDRPFIQLALQKQMPDTPPVELKEGMVIALETWYGEPGSRDGVRLEDMIVVTKDGYERLCTFPIDCLIDVWNKRYISVR
ncbi:MAG: aminopeptidase P family protein [Eubacterium sp.]|nr:aminopeptidase P family protein [Eubacterium sp.]